jgi:hypothetical protein
MLIAFSVHSGTSRCLVRDSGKLQRKKKRFKSIERESNDTIIIIIIIIIIIKIITTINNELQGTLQQPGSYMGCDLNI